MCGIAGAAWSDPKFALDRSALESMQRVMHHRGPDERGIFQSPAGAALVHVRLSIIDLSTGQQPLGNEDGTIQVVFNGEIYNFHELRRALLERGHIFQTSSDTEVIVHLYEEHGVDSFRMLRGMFAIALWDDSRRRLVLARDRMGKKPIVYWQQDGRLSFASEIKAIQEIPDSPREVDPVAVDQYLTYGYVPHPRTIYRSIRKFPPGCYGVYESNRLEIRKYWGDKPDESEAASESEWAERLHETLSEATRIRLISEVPLGAFLSGGLDSSVICALMQQHSSRPVKTFSIRFPNSDFDEGDHAQAVARHLGTDHHEFFVTETSREVVPQLVWHFDEPFADASAIPTYFVSKYARQEVTVALTGDGADELFCGYDRYSVLQQSAILDWLPISARRLLAAPFQAWRGSRRFLGRGKTMLDLASRSPEGRYTYISAVGFRSDCRAELYTPDFLAELDGYSPLEYARDAYARSTGSGVADRASLADQETYLPGDILAKVDITSMANSLECRSPFLDAEVVDLARAMPESLKLRGGIGKHIVRRVFGKLLPPVTIKRPKQGFVLPIRDWLRNDFRPLVQDVLLEERSLSRGYFRPEAVRRLVDEHLAGTSDHARRLWALLWLELWQRTFVDSAQPELVTL